MNIRDFVYEWNNSWSVDLWWRQKHNIPFNSEKHREVTQLDIAFEYLEYKLSKSAVDKMLLDEDKKKMYLETGKWIDKARDVEKEKILFEKIDLSSF